MKLSRGEKIYVALLHVIMILAGLICLLPVLNVFARSLSSVPAVAGGKVWFWPVEFNPEGWKYVLQRTSFLNSMGNSVIITLLGTSINLLFTFTGAYALSKSRLPGMRACMLLITFTMFFGGGLIPTYMLVSDLGMRNTFWAMILPGAVSAYNLVLVRNYYQKNIPEELLQAAMIDGCDDMRVFRSIVLPLSVPMLATMALFYGVGHWNQFFDALIYLSDRSMYPLQQVLREILLINTEGTLNMAGNASEAMAEGSAALSEMINRAETMKYAVIIVASVPVLIIYPFLQRYFMKGMLVGSLKG